MTPRIQVVVRQALPALELRPQWPGSSDHVSALFSGREIGRIYQTRETSPPRWRWYIVVPMALPDWTQGTRDDAAAAKAALETAFDRLLRTTDPGRLQRAWEFEDAAMKRAQPAGMPAQAASRPVEPQSLQALLAQADNRTAASEPR